MGIDFDNVFFKGHYPQNRLYELYSEGTIFVLPSLADGFAMVVSQALACGLPVIVTTHTGAKDIIKDNFNGFIVPPSDGMILNEKIKYFYNNPEECIRMSNNTEKSISSGLTWDDYGNRLVKTLERIEIDGNKIRKNK